MPLPISLEIFGESKENNMAPIVLGDGAASILGFLIPFGIGIGFGYVLEISGFGDSRKLSGQFYFREMTVLKVMFTAIIVAMTLIYLSSALGLLKIDDIFINPTYFASGIIGGLIMGVGFIIGGFCPGTSLVAAATLKLDGVFFVLGAFFGVFLFGETLPNFSQFFHAGLQERFTLDQVLGVPVGYVVVGVLLMAYFMFYLAEFSESVFGSEKKKSISPRQKNIKLAAAATLLFMGMWALALGQPSIEKKWEWIAIAENKKIETREIFVDVREFHNAMHDPLLYNVVLDVRNEKDYNMFHLQSALYVTQDDLTNKKFAKKLNSMPPNTVKMLVSNHETVALKAYKQLRAQGVINLYILDGGMNAWWRKFPVAKKNLFAVSQKDGLENPIYIFNKAYGDSLPQSFPKWHYFEQEGLEKGLYKKPSYDKKIKIETKKTVTGACG